MSNILSIREMTLTTIWYCAMHTLYVRICAAFILSQVVSHLQCYSYRQFTVVVRKFGSNRPKLHSLIKFYSGLIPGDYRVTALHIIISVAIYSSFAFSLTYTFFINWVVIVWPEKSHFTGVSLKMNKTSNHYYLAKNI